MTVSMDDAIFEVPAAITDPMYAKIASAANSDLTTGVVGGTGTFDALMAAISAHLKAEYDKGRITGADYTKTYIELTQVAMQTALQFALQADTSYWQTQQAQIAAITARVELETAKVKYAETLYNLNTTLPAQTALTAAQTSVATNQASLLVSQKAQADSQKLLIDSQKALADVQTLTTQYQYTNILPVQFTTAQMQYESVRAQTNDLRSDAAPVAGVIGQQKALYAQQITSYKRDAEVKAAKLFTDSWITQKTMDDGITPPTGFTNASLDTILTALKTNNGLT